MIRYQYLAFKITMQLSSQTTHRKLTLHQFLRADGTQTDDVLRSQDRELLLIVLTAVIDLVRIGISISRWSAFHRVEDVNISAMEAARFNHFRQQLSRSANERSARAILVSPRALAKEGDARSHVSFAEDGFVSATRKNIATSTNRDNLLELIQSLLSFRGRQRVPWIGGIE
jgi:hypothetical protein